MAPTALPLEAFTTFGDLLKHLRKRAGLTQREMGQAVNYSESHITRLENGSRLPDPAAIKAHFIDALHLQREPEAAQRLIQLAELMHALGGDDGEGAPEAQVSLSARANNLPSQLTNFIGRVREQADVLRLLGTTRLLTLTGAGGVGKTRLALEVASNVVNRYSDGVWFVTLAAVTDPLQVSPALASVFELRDDGLPTLAALCGQLRDKGALIVLDNCEHLIHACAELAEALLLGCPRLCILATSREPLGIPGELTWRVPSMAMPEAAQLFEARALDAIPETALTDTDAAAIATICKRLDGIPLAIELAAARLRVYSLSMIAARLDDRFKLLTGGARTALPRHQTLRALIDWSYNLLSPDEQRLLRTLSVFVGGWMLEAAEYVGSDLDVLTILPQLVNKSLVTIGERFGQRRYTMLETIRQFAADKLAEHGEIDAAHERLALYLERVAHTFRDERDDVSWRIREAELDNVRALILWTYAQPDTDASLRTVVTVGLPFVWESDHQDELLKWLADGLVRGTNGSVELGLIAFGRQLGAMYFSGHNLRHRAAEAQEFVKLAEQAGDATLVIRKSEIVWWCSLAEWQRQDYDRVAALASRGLKYSASLPPGNGQDAANFHWLAGLVQMKKGNADAAAMHFMRSLHIGRDADNGEAMFLGLVGFGWMDPDEALRVGEIEIAQLITQGRDRSLARVRHAYTQSLIIRGHYLRALAVLNDCLVHWKSAGIRWHTSLGSAQVLLDLGQVAWLQGDPVLAREWYEQSLDEYRQGADKERVARLHVYFGLTRLVQGDLERAAKDFQIGLNIYRELDQPAGIALALAANARLAEALGHMERAATLFGAASAPQELLAVSILWPASPVIYQREIAQARERLSKTPWMGAWHEGEEMTLDEACALCIR